VHKFRNPENRLSKKRFHFVLAPEGVARKLSGFAFNAVSPVGLLERIPVIICSKILLVKPAYVFVGGGDVDVKLGISVTDLIRTTNAIVAEVSVPRTPNDRPTDDD
jgi:prolyl-tRNA editing enzyme YbaK/EbsC (Cys-tRNA(Pro) deacylase)